MSPDGAENIIGNALSFREEMSKRIRLELFGPLLSDTESDQKAAIKSKPTDVFSCGVFYPQDFTEFHGVDEHVGAEPTVDDAASSIDDELEPILNSKETGQKQQEEVRPEVEHQFDDGDVVDDIFSDNQQAPCSFGISFLVGDQNTLTIDVSFATYAAKRLETDGVKSTVFERNLWKFNLELELSAIGKLGSRELGDTGVFLVCLKRHPKDGQSNVTFWVRNRKEPLSASEIWKNCIFQPELVVRSSGSFHSVGAQAQLAQDDDTESNALLYRNVQSYSTGHGCAGFWELDEKEECRLVRSDFFPVHEIMPILPAGEGERFKGVDFEFFKNSRIDLGFEHKETQERIIDNASRLCASYENWIEVKRLETASLEGALFNTADRHLTKCEEALERMRQGVYRLQNDGNLMKAFRLANHGMWLQQLHGGLTSRYLDDGEMAVPDILDSRAQERSWRPFQLAFLLMNLDGLPIGDSDKINHEDSNLVDLIWFPTGGGKTEAYLGVAAVALCYSRIVDADCAGTEVIMRYTLRLLTSQQFQRATYLILALEKMRRDGVFGVADITNSEAEFSAGLWVGRELTPNRIADAHSHLKNMRSKGRQNKFAILECPWCKTSLEKSKRDKNSTSDFPGYRSLNSKSFGFFCPEMRCDFGKSNRALPISVIDEQLYAAPPSLLLSTVDKFALLPWNDGPQNFLGVSNAKAPSLVIQDELHLISGPLGSVVGHYEDLIFGVMKKADKKRTTKIIASTATIRRAREQIEGLYNRPVATFPPQGLSFDDSFFAEGAKKGDIVDGNPVFGRRYVGVFAAADKSNITSQVKLLSALLQLPMSYVEGFLPEKDVSNVVDGRDKRKLPLELPDSFAGMNPYGTLVWYFNSKRELSYADSLLTQDIAERIKTLCRRYGIPFGLRRRAVNKKELTARTKEFEIFEILKQLDIAWDPSRYSDAIDVLLATSMISVGVDIDRLGLMVVNGQPKNTSEYIQASSRVGRKQPGLVFTLYNQSRARDRSHFETFLGYHQAIYRHVEPTSVTPYSYKCRERSMAGLIIGTARHIFGISKPRQLPDVVDKLREDFENYFSRVREFTESEQDVEAARYQFETFIGLWLKKYQSADDNNRLEEFEWGTNYGPVEQFDLLKSYGQHQDEDEHEAIGMMTSMRNVDSSASLKVFTR